MTIKSPINIPKYELEHQYFLEDLAFELQQKAAIFNLVVKNFDNEIGQWGRQATKQIDKRIAGIRKEYKKRYGSNLAVNRPALQSRFWFGAISDNKPIV